MSCIFFPQRYVQWSCAISAEWRLKHFINISWYISIPVLKNGIRNTVFYSVNNGKPVYFSTFEMGRYEISKVNLSKSEYISFELFEIWALNLSLKEETMKNIHSQNVAELVHYIIVFFTQGLSTCFGDTGILVWLLFFLGLLKSLLLHLI